MRNFTFDTRTTNTGLFYWMGTNRTITSWANPGKPGCNPDIACVTFTRSSRLSPTDLDSPACVADLWASVCYTSPLPNSWWMVDLGPHLRFRLRAYMLRDGDNFFHEMIRNWALEGSEDGLRWIQLQAYVNDTSISEPFGNHTFQGIDLLNREVDVGYRFFRILQIGRNVDGSYFLNLSGMELYGLLFSTWAPDRSAAMLVCLTDWCRAAFVVASADADDSCYLVNCGHAGTCDHTTNGTCRCRPGYQGARCLSSPGAAG